MRKWMRWGVAVIALLAVGVWAYYPQAKAAPLLAYDHGTSYLVITPLPEGLKPGKAAIKASYLEFPNHSFFAAFAIGPEGRYAWVGGRHNRQTAQFGAMERCGPDCVIFLENLPNHYQPDQQGRSVAQKLVDTLDLTPSASAQPRYYALAANGAWAMQKPADEGLLVAWNVVQRCNAVAYPDKRVPVLVNGCALFYGPVVVAADADKAG
ncbi:MAG: hypothetical protein V4586_14495 [Pseudomonadota bacterium]